MIDNSTKPSCHLLKSNLKLFCIGIILGCIGGLLWQEIFNPLKLIRETPDQEDYSILKEESDEKLLKYIEGKWTSSIGDLIIQISDADNNGNFIVMQNIVDKQRAKKVYKIVSIEKVNGLLGIVNLNVCEENNTCQENKSIPIQINKVFGIKETIVISYSSDFSYCVPITSTCSRAFKQVE